MAILRFPPIESADEYGLVAVGGDLEVDSLLLAYSSGIFPWPISGVREIPWFSPPERALLFFEDYKPSKSLLKLYNSGRYQLKIDHDFAATIRACATTPRRHEKSTWISSKMQKAYTDFHRAGYAHSIECYRDNKLVGGLYGVSLGKMFAGESMFHLEANASKLCFHRLVEHLKSHGAAWLDCQNMTPFMKQLGAREVAREYFLGLLVEAVNSREKMFQARDLTDR